MRNIKHSEHKRQEFINVARQLFFNNGIARTSINDIIENTHSSKGCFYYYFSSKELLIDIILSEELNKFHEEIRKITTNQDSSLCRRFRDLIYSVLVSSTEFKFIKELYYLQDYPLRNGYTNVALNRCTDVFSDFIEECQREQIINIRYVWEITHIVLWGIHNILRKEGSAVVVSEDFNHILGVVEDIFNIQPGSLQNA